MTWRRDEIDLGQRFVTGDAEVVYEVVAIADSPTVVLRVVNPIGDTIPELHYVIESADFARWRRVRYEGPQQ